MAWLLFLCIAAIALSHLLFHLFSGILLLLLSLLLTGAALIFFPPLLALGSLIYSFLFFLSSILSSTSTSPLLSFFLMLGLYYVLWKLYKHFYIEWKSEKENEATIKIKWKSEKDIIGNLYEEEEKIYTKGPVHIKYVTYRKPLYLHDNASISYAVFYKEVKAEKDLDIQYCSFHQTIRTEGEIKGRFCSFHDEVILEGPGASFKWCTFEEDIIINNQTSQKAVFIFSYSTIKKNIIVLDGTSEVEFKSHTRFEGVLERK